jgi:serine/threonine-protein kinase
MGDHDDPLIGREIAGRYRLKRRLGAGGMGVVYQAVQTSLARDVVIKLMRADIASDPFAVKRFQREAKLLARLSHPHVVTAFDSGRTDDGMLFLAMEHLEGHTLKERLASHGALPWQGTVSVIRAVAQALSLAARMGIVHRDLKPANIMLVGSGADFVKVLDFGLATIARADDVDISHPARLTLVGTPSYMSPEQIDGALGDERSDLYSLGVIWYELLTGKNPFRAATSLLTLERHLEETPARPSTFLAPASLPAPLEDTIMRLLAKEPATRLASADELLVLLDTIVVPAAGAAQDEPSNTLALPQRAPDATRGRRHRALPRLLIAAAALLVAAVAVVWPPPATPVETMNVRRTEVAEVDSRPSRSDIAPALAVAPSPSVTPSAEAPALSRVPAGCPSLARAPAFVGPTDKLRFLKRSCVRCVPCARALAMTSIQDVPVKEMRSLMERLDGCTQSCIERALGAP